MTFRTLLRSASLFAFAAWGGAAVLVAAPAGSSATARSVASEGATSHSVVTLRANRVARKAPRFSAGRIAAIPGRRPLTEVRTVLPVLASQVDDGGVTWHHVRIPGRPAGRTGWITAAQTTLSTTPWSINVELAPRTVEVYLRGRLVREFRAVVGTAQTPTPRGDFFVEEAVALHDDAEGGPFALALSARSAVLQEFNGGPGQIAIHGTNGLGAEFGTAASHGCVRLSTAAITWLAGRIGAGTPVSVH